MTAGVDLYCTKCQHTGATLILTPELRHRGKMVCGSCGAFIKWAGKAQVTDMDRWAVFDEEDGNYVMNFGKHKGRAIRDVIRENPEYFRWLKLNTDFETKCPDFLDLVDTIASAEGLLMNVTP